MKMCSCRECVYWEQIKDEEGEDDGLCVFRAPTVVVARGDVQTVMPITTSNTRCADGWNGEPTSDEKMALAYMEGQMLAAKQGMDS